MDSLRKSVCRGLLEQTLQPIFLRTISAKDHLTLTGREFKIALAALPVALLIAFSRLWLFAHFPTDVLGGVAVGLVIGYGTWHLLLLIPAFKRLWNRSNREEALTQA